MNRQSTESAPITTAITTVTLDREAWLIEAGNLILEDLLSPYNEGRELPLFRVSVGFPKGRSTKVVAVCYKREVSADQHNEIFVTPEVDDSIIILAALTHELIHAYDDCASGHRGFFSRCAAKVGLRKPMTATTANDTLTRELNEIVELLGNIPHAKMDRGKIKKQKTKMLKCQCTRCDFTFRTTQTWIDSGLTNYCIACGTAEQMIFNV